MPKSLKKSKISKTKNVVTSKETDEDSFACAKEKMRLIEKDNAKIIISNDDSSSSSSSSSNDNGITKNTEKEDIVKHANDIYDTEKEKLKILLETEFWDRKKSEHDVLKKYDFYGKSQEMLLEAARTPFYGRSDTEHYALKDSGFYVD
jgi:hypothetical protein